MPWIAPAQKLASKTHCVNGHEYRPETTYRKDDGWRRCKICKMIQQRAYRERKAA